MKRINNNQQGNALILVLLVTVIFTTLGLAVISATIGGAKRTVVREEEIDITYEAIEVIDDFTAELSRTLQDNENQYQISRLSTNPIGFTPILNTAMNNIIADKQYTQKDGVTEVTATTTPHPGINEAETLTRVVDLEVTTKAGSSGTQRTAKKRLIISPLPSFLKYALGSDDGVLSLNGSPNIVGNVFSNHLNIQKEAEYFTSAGEHTVNTNMPSIVGDLYAGEFDRSKFNATDMLNLIKEENFYHGQMPEWKNDSQYQEIQFKPSFTEERENAMADNQILEHPNTDSLFIGRDLSSVSGVPPLLQSQIIEDEKGSHYPDPYKLVNTNLPATDELALEGNLLVTNTAPMEVGTLLIKGNLTIVANAELTVKNIYLTGNLEIINNPGGEITINGETVSEGNITIDNEGIFETTGKLASHSSLSINNKGNISMAGTAASGTDFQIENASATSEFQANNTIASLSSFSIKNKGIANFPGNQNNIFARDAIDFKNEGELTVEHNLYAEGTFSNEPDTANPKTLAIESSGPVSLSGDIFSGCDTCRTDGKTSLIIHDSRTSFTGNLFSQGPLTIRGDQSDTGEENDHLIADGVMYANGETLVSNLNILGKDENGSEKQLILLSGEKLTITRINEFSNFTNNEEKTDNYLPSQDPFQTNIQPLKAFFYTDKEAELYGVGSLFYINGGLFSKGDMTVNGIRGTVNNQAHLLNMQSDEDNKLSRFIINYNEEILLQYIDTLPKVEYLSLYSGELTVE